MSGLVSRVVSRGLGLGVQGVGSRDDTCMGWVNPPPSNGYHKGLL